MLLLLFAISSSVRAFLLPFYMQDVLHHSPSFMGLIFLSAPIFTIALAAPACQLTDYIGPRIPTSIGVAMIMAAFVVGRSRASGRASSTPPTRRPSSPRCRGSTAASPPASCRWYSASAR
jgi:MFS family permease